MPLHIVRNDITKMKVDAYIVVFDRTAFQISGKLFDAIQEYIDDL